MWGRCGRMSAAWWPGGGPVEPDSHHTGRQVPGSLGWRGRGAAGLGAGAKVCVEDGEKVRMRVPALEVEYGVGAWFCEEKRGQRGEDGLGPPCPRPPATVRRQGNFHAEQPRPCSEHTIQLTDPLLLQNPRPCLLPSPPRHKPRQTQTLTRRFTTVHFHLQLLAVQYEARCHGK